MTDSIEEELKNLNAEFEKAIAEVKTPDSDPDPDPDSDPEIPTPPPEDSELQAKYDYIVEANQRNQKRIRHLMKLLTQMGEKAAKLGLRFNEMDALAS